PFTPDAGLRLMQGREGRGESKKKAVEEENRKVKENEKVNEKQEDEKGAFEEGENKRENEEEGR
ncbi:hypothetical protein OIV50_32080, partial [Burkholderia pseudomallei]|uniref:hypothetical protein n=1 Tax=Burkholderia pseudomallei TaxID=28450 RepID=UPI0021F7C79D